LTHQSGNKDRRAGDAGGGGDRGIESPNKRAFAAKKKRPDEKKTSRT